MTVSLEVLEIEDSGMNDQHSSCIDQLAQITLFHYFPMKLFIRASSPITQHNSVTCTVNSTDLPSAWSVGGLRLCMIVFISLGHHFILPTVRPGDY